MNDDKKVCPECAETIKAAAKVCKHCGYRIPDPALVPVKEEAWVPPEEPIWTAPPPSIDGPGWWDRTFDDGRTAKRGCFGFLLALIVGFFLLTTHCARQASLALNEQEASDAIANEQASEEASDNRRQGFHCLSPIDGSHPAIVSAVKRGLRDPKSYEHIETQITPLDASGKHQLMMHYRATNGFGGMTDGVVTATVDPATCKASVVDAE
jgi:hypothetical protein